MDINDKIFDFVYEMAFRDATMRKAFSKKENEDDKAYGERKKNVKDIAKDKVSGYIQKIFDDNVGEKTCIKTIFEVTEATEEFGFTFGNAQKLVNMTAKYMYISAFGDEDMRKKFRLCHCPMDRHMIETVINNAGNKSLSPLKKDTPWSTMEIVDNQAPEEYLKFQEAVKNECKIDGKEIYPIEYDYYFFE